MHLFQKLILSALLTAGLAGTAAADELRLSDGSAITGEVSRWTADHIVITTTFAGDLTIPRSYIKQIIADDKVLVEVNTGDKIVGTLQVDKDKGQLLTGTTFGDLKLDMAQVRSITAAHTDAITSVSTVPGTAATAPAANPQSAAATPAGTGASAVGVTTPAPSPVAAAGPANPPFAPATPLYTSPPTKWTARIEMGADGAAGNTERLSARGRAEARRTTDIDRLLLYFQGTYAKQNGTRSANEILGGADLEVDLTKRLFAFGKSSLEYDEFEDLDLRAMVTAGLGYFWIRQDQQFLKTRGGIGYMHESFMSGGTEDTGILELGVDYMKQISPWLRYNHSTTYYPTFNSVSDFRIVMENAAEIPITKDKDWKIRLGMKNSYDSEPVPGVERLDTTYFANLVWDFK